MRKKLVLTLSTIGVLVAAAVLATTLTKPKVFAKDLHTDQSSRVSTLCLRLAPKARRAHHARDNIPAAPRGRPDSQGNLARQVHKGSRPAGAGLKLMRRNGATIGR